MKGLKRQPAVLYDGGCPLCRREIAHYRRLDQAGRIRWLDIHADPELPVQLGVSWESAMQRIHVADPGGVMQVGVKAFLVIWDHLPGYSRLAALIRWIPGLVPALDAGYAAFARWRWRRRCREGVCGP